MFHLMILLNQGDLETMNYFTFGIKRKINAQFKPADGLNQACQHRMCPDCCPSYNIKPNFKTENYKPNWGKGTDFFNFKCHF